MIGNSLRAEMENAKVQILKNQTMRTPTVSVGKNGCLKSITITYQILNLIVKALLKLTIRKM